MKKNHLKRQLIRVALIVVLIFLGVYLYNVGKLHKVYIENKEITLDNVTYQATSSYKVWIDGQEIGDLRQGKRKLAKVIGSNHRIIVQEVVDRRVRGPKFEKQFTLKVTEKATVNIPALLNDLHSWIKKEDV